MQWKKSSICITRVAKRLWVCLGISQGGKGVHSVNLIKCEVRSVQAGLEGRHYLLNSIRTNKYELLVGDKMDMPARDCAGTRNHGNVHVTGELQPPEGSLFLFCPTQFK